MSLPKWVIEAQNNPTVCNGFVEVVGPRVLELVEAAKYVRLNRYKLRPGKLYGNPRNKERFKVIELSGNTVVYKDLVTNKITYDKVDDLLENWNLSGYMEISNIDVLLERVKEYLTPFLGGVIVSALISWIMKRL